MKGQELTSKNMNEVQTQIENNLRALHILMRYTSLLEFLIKEYPTVLARYYEWERENA